MKRSVVLFPIVLALGAIILAPRGGAQAQDTREGPREIDKCQTISEPGSYRLVRNLVFTATTGSCLVITVNSVTIDLAGFTISGASGGGIITGIIAAPPDSGRLRGIAVRNGSISNFNFDVDLGLAEGSIVEGLSVFGATFSANTGTTANGIVKGNTVIAIRGTGIVATGIVTGNYESFSLIGMGIGQGSTLIGNTATSNIEIGPEGGVGIDVSCPSNVTDNTAVNNTVSNIVLIGEGCNNTNNVAP